MAVIQNTSKADRHLVIHEIVNSETGEGKNLEYIVPHRRYKLEDLTQETESGKREIPDWFIEKARKNVAVNALFEEGILTVLSNASANEAEKRETKYNGSLSKKVNKIETDARINAAVSAALSVKK